MNRKTGFQITHRVHGPEPEEKNERNRWRRAWTYRELHALLPQLREHGCRVPSWVMTRLSVEHVKALKVGHGVRGPTVNGMTAETLDREMAGEPREVERPFSTAKEDRHAA